VIRARPHFPASSLHIIADMTSKRRTGHSRLPVSRFPSGVFGNSGQPATKPALITSLRWNATSSRAIQALASLPTSRQNASPASQPASIQYTSNLTTTTAPRPPLPTRLPGPVTASNPSSAPLPHSTAWPAIFTRRIHQTASLASSRSTCLLMLISALPQQHTLHTTSSRARTTS